MTLAFLIVAWVIFGALAAFLIWAGTQGDGSGMGMIDGPPMVLGSSMALTWITLTVLYVTG